MIKVEQLTGGYQPDKPIVQDVSFKVGKGEFFTIIGPNGSGKTTLFKLLTGILPCDSGVVKVGGNPLDSYSMKERARLIAVLAQEERVEFDFTVKEIVMLGRFAHQRGLFRTVSEEDRDVVDRVMTMTDMKKYEDLPFRMLSGGEKQRVLLAKALAQEPDILLLDEPTNHLDIRHTFDMLNLLKDYQRKKGLTVIAILHDLNIASIYSNRIGLMNHGRVIAIGEGSILKNEDLLEEIYGVKVTTGAHPNIAVPQVFLTPEEQLEKERQKQKFIYDMVQEEEWIHIAFKQPLKVISNSVVGGGFHWAQHFCNFHVEQTYDSKTPDEDIKRWLKERRLPVPVSVGMMTAIHMEDVEIMEREVEKYRFFIAVTAGLGNPVDITHASPESSKRNNKVGTINIMLFIDGHLSDEAFINAIQSATEAKTKAVFDYGAIDPVSGTAATGTSTDSIAIGATQKGEKTPFAGSGTVLGQGIGSIVHDAVTGALEKYEERKKKN